ncbi:MAG TPA: ThiF family adenylyltransferase [Kribbellaceae bacterium]|jgi:hypothetical protein
MTTLEIETVAAAEALTADEFYAELTRRNRGLISAAQQQALEEGTVLVAGCGSVGGAAVQPLARLGVRRFLVADSGAYELNNLNRQHAGVADIGRNKAEVAAERILSVNPHAEVRVFPEGVTTQNVDELTATCQVIVDGVDVTMMSGLRAKFALHEKAVARRLPLVTGWDMAGCLYAQHFDYRTVALPFDGAITAGDLDRLTTWELIFRMVPLRRIPGEFLAELSPNLGNTSYSVPQLVQAALMFGAVSSHMVAKLLAGEHVPAEVSLDVHQAVRRPAARLASVASWPGEALRMIRALKRYQQEIHHGRHH